MSNRKAEVFIDGNKVMDLPILIDTMENEALDIRALRKQTGMITYDPGFGNTGSCQSQITYLDGEKGILRYRGYPIEELIEKCDFIEVAYLLIHGHLPSKAERERYTQLLNRHSLLHVDMQSFFRRYPEHAHPMSILAAMSVSLSSFYEINVDEDPELEIDLTVTRLMSKIRTIAAFTYRKMRGSDFVNPRHEYSYCGNFLNMLFSSPVVPYEPNPVHIKALNKLLILHADHEQNCSTTAVRLVGSAGGGNLYSAVSAGICALWGPRHGGANQAVIDMLQQIHDDGGDVQKAVDRAKDKNDPYRLMGFGHRVYKTYDPRAKIGREICEEVLADLGIKDPLLEIAEKLEETALQDDYFKERFLYPNVDFYTGIIFRAMNIPTNMYTVLFSMGRLPGWIAHWLEWRHDPFERIGRPRQLYMGPTARSVPHIDERE